MAANELFMKLAIEEAVKGIRAGDGGPFGAVIVRTGEILGIAHNTVLKSHDPTAHAEINAIRDACRKLSTHHLSGAVIYTNFEPCPMCLGAIYWADIRSVCFCADRETAERIGFMDNHLYREISEYMGNREITYTRVSMKEMDELIDEWNSLEGRAFY